MLQSQWFQPDRRLKRVTHCSIPAKSCPTSVLQSLVSHEAVAFLDAGEEFHLDHPPVATELAANRLLSDAFWYVHHMNRARLTAQQGDVQNHTAAVFDSLTGERRMTLDL